MTLDQQLRALIKKNKDEWTKIQGIVLVRNGQDEIITRSSLMESLDESVEGMRAYTADHVYFTLSQRMPNGESYDLMYSVPRSYLPKQEERFEERVDKESVFGMTLDQLDWESAGVSRASVTRIIHALGRNPKFREPGKDRTQPISVGIVYDAINEIGEGVLSTRNFSIESYNALRSGFRTIGLALPKL